MYTFLSPSYKSFCPQVKIYDSLIFMSSSLKMEKMTFLLHSFCGILCIWLGV